MIVKLIYATVCFLVFLQFGLSIFNVFVSHKNYNKLGYLLLRIGNVFCWIGTFYLIYSFEYLSWVEIFFGGLAQLTCLAIFLHLKSYTQKKLTIAFSLDQPTFLIKIGPYKYVRHPYYSCYLFSYLSILLIMPHWISLVNFVTMFFVYFWAALLEEQKFMRSALYEDYLTYKKETGRFLPRQIVAIDLKKSLNWARREFLKKL